MSRPESRGSRLRVPMLVERYVLVIKLEDVAGRIAKPHRVRIRSVFHLDRQRRLQLARDLRAEVQVGRCTPGGSHVLLKTPAHHFVDQAEERDQVALASAVRADQDVDGAEFQVQRPDGAKTANPNRLQTRAGRRRFVLLHRGSRLFGRSLGGGRRLSFVDCTSFELMPHHGIRDAHMGCTTGC